MENRWRITKAHQAPGGAEGLELAAKTWKKRESAEKLTRNATRVGAERRLMQMFHQLPPAKQSLLVEIAESLLGASNQRRDKNVVS